MQTWYSRNLDSHKLPNKCQWELNKQHSRGLACPSKLQGKWYQLELSLNRCHSSSSGWL